MPRTRHGFEPRADQLEAHVLLSSASAALALTPPITETLTTDKAAYKVGQPVEITLTETNRTDAVVTMPAIGHSGGFTATRDFKVVWMSPAHRRSTASLTLQPGQTRTITVAWNGHANVASASHSAPLTGTFLIDNTLANNTVTIVIDPRHGKGSTAGPTSSVPNEPFILTSG